MITRHPEERSGTAPADHILARYDNRHLAAQEARRVKAHYHREEAETGAWKWKYFVCDCEAR